MSRGPSLTERLGEIEERLGPWSETVERRVRNVLDSCGTLPERMARIENKLNALDVVYRRLDTLEKQAAESRAMRPIIVQNAEFKV